MSKINIYTVLAKVVLVYLIPILFPYLLGITSSVDVKLEVITAVVTISSILFGFGLIGFQRSDELSDELTGGYRRNLRSSIFVDLIVFGYLGLSFLSYALGRQSGIELLLWAISSLYSNICTSVYILSSRI